MIKLKGKYAVIVFGILLFCTLFNEYRVFSWIAIFSFVAVMLFYLKNYTYFLFKYFPFVFSAISLITGVAVAEFSTISMYEISSRGQFVGSLPLIILAYYLFFSFLFMFDNREIISMIDKEPEEKSKKTKIIIHYLAIISAMLFFIQFIRIIRYPAFLLGYDRFTYARKIGANTGIFKIVDSLSYAFLTFSILDLANGFKKAGIIGICFYILYYLWNGNKFGPFLTLLCFFLIVFYKKLSVNRKQIKRILIVAGALMVIFVIFATILTSNVMGTSRMEYLIGRIAQQGQLWWKTYSITEEMHIKEIIDEVKGTIHGSTSIVENVDANYGIYKIMYLCGRKTYITYKLSNGSRFTEAGFAASYYYLGVVGVILFSFITAFVVAKTLNKLINAIKCNSYYKIVVFSRFYMLEREAMSMFLFANFLDTISLISYGYLFTLYLLKKMEDTDLK